MTNDISAILAQEEINNHSLARRICDVLVRQGSPSPFWSWLVLGSEPNSQNGYILQLQIKATVCATLPATIANPSLHLLRWCSYTH